jgi:hypothetical protein
VMEAIYPRPDFRSAHGKWLDGAFIEPLWEHCGLSARLYMIWIRQLPSPRSPSFTTRVGPSRPEMRILSFFDV